MARIVALVAVAVVETLLAAALWALACGAVGKPGDLLGTTMDILGGMWRIVLRPSEVITDPGSAALFLLPPLSVGVCSALFLAPLAGPLATSKEPRSMRRSVLAAGFVAGGLVVGAVFGLAELIGLLMRGTPGVFTEEWQVWATLGLFLPMGWIAWSVVLWRHGERMDHGVARRLLRLLFRGTVVELAVVVPAYAWARSRESCYCALSSFWGLAAGITALLFLAGPGAFLLWARRTGRWRSRSCPGCGYQRGPGALHRCPECGAAWGRERATDGI